MRIAKKGFHLLPPQRVSIDFQYQMRAAAQVVRSLVDKGFLHEPEAAAAIDALATDGLMEAALVQAAIAEAEELVARHDDDGES